MGAGPLQQPLLAGGEPSAPPLSGPGGAFAPAGAPPGAHPPMGAYPPYDVQQRSGAYPPPPVVGAPAYGAPHGAYAPPPVAVAHHTHVYEGPLITRVQLAPVSQVCSACGSTGNVRVRRERGMCTWLQAFALCWLAPCIFWLPCCLDCSKDLVHRCSNCGAEVARVAPC